jgi:glycopeptide antibiotics resistance protein
MTVQHGDRLALHPSAIPVTLAVDERAESRARLSGAVLVYYGGIILLITLVPFRFTLPAEIHMLWTGGVTDTLANIALFVPIGILYPISSRGRLPARALRAILLGGVFSLSIELAQTAEPERYSSVIDVFANTTGTALGAALLLLVRRRLGANARLRGRISLELPLMGLLYLVVPLVWLSALTIGDEPIRWILPALLCAFGGRLWSVLLRFHFGPLAGVSVRQMRLAAALWALVGMAPAAQHPAGVVLLALLAAVCVQPGSALEHSGERRFEQAALTHAMPMFLAFLAALIVLPIAGGLAHWRMSLGFPSTARALSTIEQLRTLGCIAAASVLGYLVAEMGGRRELPYSRVVPRLVALSAVFAVGLEAVRGLQPGIGASVAEGVLVSMAGPYGGWIYHLQRILVRSRSNEPALRGASSLRRAG